MLGLFRQACVRQKTTRSASRYVYPRLHALEERLTPVNDVQATLSGGTLTITTVDQLGAAEVLADDNDQEFVIVGLGPGSVAVDKTANTKVNGGTSEAFNGVTNIVIDLKQGDDKVTCKALELAGNLTFKGGDGFNQFDLNANGFQTNVKNVSIINTGEGGFFVISNGVTAIHGALTVTNGGASNTDLGVLVTDKITIDGAITFNNGDGDNFITFQGGDFEANGPVTIKNGNGDNFVAFESRNSTVFTKPISVTNGAGDNLFVAGLLGKSTSFASITINNGIGNNTTEFRSSVSDTINGNLSITNKAGDDNFLADSGKFAVTGNIKIKNGVGNSTTELSPTTTNTVGGSFSLINAAGNDSTSIFGTTVDYKSVNIQDGNGDSDFELTGTNLTVASICITNGDGFDTVNLSASLHLNVVTGGFKLKNGVGGTPRQ